MNMEESKRYNKEGDLMSYLTKGGKPRVIV